MKLCSLILVFNNLSHRLIHKDLLRNKYRFLQNRNIRYRYLQNTDRNSSVYKHRFAHMLKNHTMYLYWKNLHCTVGFQNKVR